MTKRTIDLDTFWYAANLIMKDGGKPELSFYDARYYWDRARHETEMHRERERMEKAS